MGLCKLTVLTLGSLSLSHMEGVSWQQAPALHIAQLEVMGPGRDTRSQDTLNRWPLLWGKMNTGFLGSL
jgi:hypothetical protein